MSHAATKAINDTIYDPTFGCIYKVYQSAITAHTDIDQFHYQNMYKSLTTVELVYLRFFIAIHMFFCHLYPK